MNTFELGLAAFPIRCNRQWRAPSASMPTHSMWEDSPRHKTLNFFPWRYYRRNLRDYYYYHITIWAILTRKKKAPDCLFQVVWQDTGMWTVCCIVNTCLGSSLWGTIADNVTWFSFRKKWAFGTIQYMVMEYSICSVAVSTQTSEDMFWYL